MIPDPGSPLDASSESQPAEPGSGGTAEDLPLGVILAGGASRRFGSPKALAPVGGAVLACRVRDALRSAVPDPVLIANHPDLFDFLDLPTRADVVPGAGPLAGLHAALLWARERGRRGALVVACDLPFLDADLLRRIVRRSGETAADVVAPEGSGRLEVEPLCAWYSCAVLPQVEGRLERGELSMGRLLQELRVERIPLRDVRGFGDPDVLFHNVNTRADQARAEQIARVTGNGHGTG